METETPQTTKRQKRTANFNVANKRRLVHEVEARPVIWNSTHPNYSNKNAIAQAWRAISKSMSKSVDECKIAWTALRESYRYRARAAKKGKSGSAAGSALEDSVDWEFSPDLSFLPNPSRKRRNTLNIPLIEPTEETMPEFTEESMPEFKREPSYEYVSPRSKRSRSSTPICEEDSTIWDNFDNKLDKQTTAFEMHSILGRSRYTPAFLSFDYFLNQLSEEDANDACLEFSNSLIARVNKGKKTKQIYIKDRRSRHSQRNQNSEH